MKMTRLSAGILGAALVTCLSSTAFAQTADTGAGAATPAAQGKAYAGILLGLSNPNKTNSSMQVGYGLQGGYNVYDWLGVGAYLWSSKQSTSALQAGVSTPQDNRLTVYGIEGQYNMMNVLPGGFVGARLGLATQKESVGNGPSRNSTDFALGPKVGYDYMLRDTLSVGGEANVMFITGAPANDSSSEWNIFGSLKFHL